MYRSSGLKITTQDLNKTFIFLFRNMINRTHPNTFILKKEVYR